MLIKHAAAKAPSVIAEIAAPAPTVRADATAALKEREKLASPFLLGAILKYD